MSVAVSVTIPSKECSEKECRNRTDVQRYSLDFSFSSPVRGIAPSILHE